MPVVFREKCGHGHRYDVIGAPGTSCIITITASMVCDLPFLLLRFLLLYRSQSITDIDIQGMLLRFSHSKHLEHTSFPYTNYLGRVGDTATKKVVRLGSLRTYDLGSRSLKTFNRYYTRLSV